MDDISGKTLYEEDAVAEALRKMYGNENGGVIR